jgi:hypothetical protein
MMKYYAPGYGDFHRQRMGRAPTQAFADQPGDGDPRFRDYAKASAVHLPGVSPYFRSTTEAHADWGTKLPLRNFVTVRAR